jgi:hypothetical protein
LQYLQLSHFLLLEDMLESIEICREDIHVSFLM